LLSRQTAAKPHIRGHHGLQLFFAEIIFLFAISGSSQSLQEICRMNKDGSDAFPCAERLIALKNFWEERLMSLQTEVSASRTGGSVTLELQRVRKGDHPTTRKLFDLWFRRLSQLGNKLLASHEQRVSDGEDLAQIVLANFFCSLEAGFLDAKGNPIPIHSRLDVWRMLTARLRQRALNVKRDQRADSRGGGRVRGESAFMSRDDFPCSNGIQNVPSPETAALEDGIDSMHSELINAFRRDGLRRIAKLTLEGNTASEIAAELGLSTATVYRKLDLIHQHWETLSSVPK